jgi:uncharacterized protein (TIGR02996 family)
MTDRDALLSAIEATPLDDAPRLILADWLDEHGEPERAEFIRLQVAQRREFDENGRTVRLEELFVQARALFYQPWAEPVRIVFGRPIAFYSRGFPKGPGYEIISAEQLVTHLPAVASWIGPDSPIRVKAAPGELKELAAIPQLGCFRTLEICTSWRDEPTIGDTDVADLLSSPYLVSLRSLTVRSHALTDAAAEAIRNAASLRSLESLNLAGNQLGRAGAVALARSPHLATLRVLDLSNNRIGNASVKALLKSPYLAGLISLKLTGNPHTVAVATQLEKRFPSPIPCIE